jgi:hypothetical protein
MKKTTADKDMGSKELLYIDDGNKEISTAIMENKISQNTKNITII